MLSSKLETEVGREREGEEGKERGKERGERIN